MPLYSAGRVEETGVMERPLLVLLFFAYSCCSLFSVAQSSIPAKYDGFPWPYGGSRGCDDSILVEAFLDPLCPDSRDSWLPLKQVIEHYSPRLSLIVHPFPLPYHNNAFLACRALHIANKLNASSTITLLELFFKNQERYDNAPTRNLSRASIVGDMAKLAVTTVGKPLAEFLSGFQDSATDTAARVSFKYGCSRAVSGAPFFFVNGFLLPDAGSALDYQTWTSIIGPLLGKHQQTEKEPPLSSYVTSS